MSLKARKRLSIIVLLIGMPAYVVVAVTVVNMFDLTQHFLLQLLVYVGLGIVWILPFRELFRGIGQPGPDDE
ncbi:DUF2842 domain-containing protein [Rhodalgimonas zhirmunskyi]|uniref:DUF2842 domain-containing protein n=1 Tax=Rhodalgimonas zhirmunskyi TaxID=2964767 RepID=UPI00352FF400